MNNARLVLSAISRTPLIKRKLLLDNIDISKATLERISSSSHQSL